uniref:serine/threonine-protein kinase Nek10 isoform X2 n=1 Tax=Doryrhamphus excisus TaxID=161450 RepID=UPI0025AE7D96|nr:serine/threonine-protein kinase Nek10 isoform X2 [Doryrhamphus excisus]
MKADPQVTHGSKSWKMSKQVKKVRQERQPSKPTGIHTEPSCDLRRLRALLAKSSPKQEVSSHSKAGSSRFHSPHPPRDSCSEAFELERFSMTYREERCFSSHPLHKLFSDVLASLVKNRLCSEWIDIAPPESVLRVLLCLRLLIRDPQHQKMLHCLQGVSSLAKYMSCAADMYLACGEQVLAAQSLVAMTYTFQKLSATENQRVWVIESGAHMTLVKLLSTTDSSVLLGALMTLTTLAESLRSRSPQCRDEIGALAIAENLLVILQEYDLLSKRMAAELLRRLSPVQHVRDELRELEGLPVLLSLLHTQHLKLLWSVAWILVQLCQDSDTRTEMRSWGGVQPLLRLLSSHRRFDCDRLSIEKLSSANAAGRIHRESAREELSPLEEVNDVVALQSACCTALTELSLDDWCAHHIVQENGIYILAKLILPQSGGPKVSSLQCYTFRALRFLFSVERNRHHFKRLFPTDLFEVFIDVGHYVRDLQAYEGLQIKLSQYSEDELESLRESITAMDQNRPALKVIHSYAILDHLGTGAFGSVFKVRKQSGQNLLALKEINLHNPAFGKDKKSRDSNVEKIISELAIIKEQMAHPNVVKYYKTFLEDDKLYIVMELIEGVPLLERCNSLKEKQEQFTEDQIWNIFIQMCLALRYLHKEKRIVHRDLTPNNIMLGEKDKVTITDFGLAKQKQENSKLTSVVGTILYSCPEVVKNEPYGEKADIWALGCIIYQMATLEPPFYSTNMLSLASKIVEAVYEPLEEGRYSDRLQDMITWCLSPDADQRPDIVAVSSRISDLMMWVMDSLYTSQNVLERRAERDRKRAQRYFMDRHKSCPQKETFMTADLPVVYFPANCSPNQIEEHLSLDEASDEDVETIIARNAGGEPHGSKCAACVVPQPPQRRLREDLSPVRMKSKPASAGIYVSQRGLRQIKDPIQRLLEQLHKVVYISQLPPAPRHNIKRRLVERFKKSLFQFGSDPQNLKVELSKLVQASSEQMDSGFHPFAGDLHFNEDSAGTLREGVTYQQMQGIVEELLEESGYYEATHSRGADKRSRPCSYS